jgi:hypothetical protein
VSAGITSLLPLGAGAALILGPGVTVGGDAHAARASAAQTIPNLFLVSNALSLTRACLLDANCSPARVCANDATLRADVPTA